MDQTPAFFLGRQPILDRNLETMGYELLFRTGPTGGAQFTDHRMATASVIAHAFNELGIDTVLGSCRGFINFDADLLMSDVVELLPPERTVVELLETVTVTDEVVERCRNLRREGFRFALDDLVKVDSSHAPLLPLVDIVKVDIPRTPAEDIPRLLAQARKSRVKLLAEKVDSREQAQWCLDMGFDLFQGFFFARPVVLKGRRADPSKQILLHLLQLVLAGADNGEIEQTFKHAPVLSYKLMRLVNSVSMGLRSQIQSLSHALVVLGRRHLQRWLQVLLFADHNTGEGANPLMVMAATRGKLMELLAERQSSDPAYADRAFMTGILSLMDALLDTPIETVVEQLNLPDDVRAALLTRQGDLGHQLKVVEATERGDDGAVLSLLAGGRPCPLTELPAIQVAAMAWADGIMVPRADA